ncbi:MAG: phage protein D [Candidatus Methylomirabilis sp.]|nr:phage protein D [Deltaproteobacteria bacterium]
MERFAPKASWRIAYRGRVLDGDVAASVVSVTYTDALHGESDSIELLVDDGAGRWRGPWFPEKGDEVRLWIGYEGWPLLPCGRFEVDEAESDFAARTMTIRALAARITQEIRTKRTDAFEDQSLAEIAGKVAARHGLEVVGPVPAVRFARVTQTAENDLEFLKRLADDYGLVTTLRDRRLVFHERGALEAAPPVVTLEADILGKGSTLRSKAKRTYRAARVSWHDPQANALVTHTEGDPSASTADTLVIEGRAENAAQASAMARARLARANAGDAEGLLIWRGEARLVAGNNLTLAGAGRWSGKYLIQTSRHRLDRAGAYRTEMDVEGVA